MKTIKNALMFLALTLPVAAVADGLVVIVNPKNATAITPEKISDIYLGKNADFAASDLPDGTEKDAFYQKLTGRDAGQIKSHWSRLLFSGKAQPLKELPNDGEVKKYVAGNPNAIGYISQSAADASVKVIHTLP